MKRFVCCCLLLLLLFALTACGTTEKETRGQSGDPEAMLINAMEKLDQLESFASTATADMEMGIGDQTVAMQSTMETVTFLAPFRMRLEMTATSPGGDSEMTTLMYLEEAGDGYALFIHDGSAWNRQTVDEDFIDEYDSGYKMALNIAAISELTVGGTETVNGEDAIRIDGVITGDALLDVLDASGALSSLGLDSMEEEELSQMLDQIGDVAVALWIGNTSGYPLRYAMDLTDMLAGMLEALSPAENQPFSFTVNRYTMDAELTDFNAAADFEIPAEARGE